MKILIVHDSCSQYFRSKFKVLGLKYKNVNTQIVLPSSIDPSTFTSFWGQATHNWCELLQILNLDNICWNDLVVVACESNFLWYTYTVEPLQVLIFNLLVVQIIVLFYLRMDCWLCLWWRLWRRSYILIILNPDNKVMALENPLAYLRLPFLAWRSPREPQTIFPLKETMINKQTMQL